MQVSDTALHEVREALERYKEVIARAGLTESSEQTYVLHAEHFVRWLADDFLPGERKAGKSARS